MSTSPPRLTFFTELEKAPLVGLFSDTRVIDQIVALKARVSMGILDFSSERASIVRELNARGVPMIAWQLLPKEQGYWYNLDSASFAAARYRQFCEWTSREGLKWDAIGIDIEPHIDEFRELLTYNFRTLFSLVKRTWSDSVLFGDARAVYESLVARMQSDGYSVQSYELFFMADERLTGSSLLSRLLGVAPTPADQRVGMLYSSLFRPVGVGLLRVYARSFDSVALGLTGGGVQLDGVAEKDPMTWGELSRDLRIARRLCDDIHIFSLEGCVTHNQMDNLASFDWGGNAHGAPGWTALLSVLRLLGCSLLWLFAHPKPVLLVILIAFAAVTWFLML